MIFDQIAIVTKNTEDVKVELAKLGAKNWVEDIVYSEGMIKGKRITNTLKLNFNYELGPYEFEILEIVKGVSFQNNLKKPGISHFGWHVEDVELKRKELEKEGYTNVGFMKTKTHSNAKNLYHYVFLENKELGIFLKLIQRLPGKNQSVYSSSMHYLDILHEAKMIRDKKVADYGERRYLLTSPEFDGMLCFSDIYRKFIRLENYYKFKNKLLVDEKLRDTYMDLINYAVMAVQILDLTLAKNKKKEDR